MYYVVNFVSENNKIEVIPSNWYDAETLIAKWPDVTSQTSFRQLLTDRACPTKQWSNCDAEIIFKAADLHQAEKYCNRYAKDSDVLMTEPEGSLPAKRIIKVPRRMQLSSYAANKENIPVASKTSARSSRGSKPLKQRKVAKPPLQASNKRIYFHDTSSEDEDEAGEDIVDAQSAHHSVPAEQIVSPYFHESVEHSSRIQESNPQEFFETSANIARPTLEPQLHSQSSPLQIPRPAITSTNEAKFRQKVLTLLETILLEQLRLKKRLDVIENSLDSSLKASGSISSGGPSDMDKSLLESLNFPAKCWNELVNINETLADKEIFQNMALYLSRIGGKKISDCISRLMPSLMVHELVHEISRTGKGKFNHQPKFRFDSLENLKKAIFAAVHKNIPEATLQQINEALGNWFRNWRDRQGGRNKRRIDGALVNTSVSVNEDLSHDDSISNS